MASGDKVAPVPIENQIKQELPIISNAMVVGDQQKYLSCLLTLKVEQDPVTGLPTNQLSPQVLEECRRIGSSAQTVSDDLEGRDHKIRKAIQQGIDDENRKVSAKIQKVRCGSSGHHSRDWGWGQVGGALLHRPPVGCFASWWALKDSLKSHDLLV